MTPTAGAVPSRTVHLWTQGGNLGSGWLYGPQSLGTAGHVVYNRNNGTYTDGAGPLTIVPGQDGVLNKPYGYCQTRNHHVPNNWITVGGVRWDYGQFQLNCNAGDTLGTLPIKNLNAYYSVGVNGYPSPTPGGAANSAEQWWDAGSVGDWGNSILWHNVDTSGGQSGSAVWAWSTDCGSGDNLCTIAVHTGCGGPSPTWGLSWNWGPKMDNGTILDLWFWGQT